MIFSLLGSSFFSTFVLYLFISFALFYIWFKLINMENEIFLLTDKVKKMSIANNIPYKPSPSHHNTCSINNPFSFNMEDIILKEVFDKKPQNTCELEATPEKNTSDNDDIKIDDVSTSNDVEIFDLKKSNESENENEGSEISTTKKTKKGKK